MPEFPETARMKTSEVDILIVPGSNPLDADHWQSRWAKRLKRAAVVGPPSTHAIEAEAWTESILAALQNISAPSVLVAHATGVAATVWALSQNCPSLLRGAFLVAPSDVCAPLNGSGANHCTSPFTSLPTTPLAVPSVVIAPSNNPHCSLARARSFAADWGSELTEAGESGALDVSSGHGPWPEGLLRFGAFLKTLP